MAILQLVALVSSAIAATPTLPQTALPVPLVRQAQPYSCGAAALLSVLFYWQKADIPESALYAILGTSEEDGTRPDKLAEGARSFGLNAQMREHLTIRELLRYLRAKKTLILSIQAWRSDKSKDVPWKDDWEDGHYVVLIGIDHEFAYFMDPSSTAGYGFMPLAEFVTRWHDVDNLDGRQWRSRHLGIIIWGDDPLKTNPGPLVRIQ